MMNNAMNYSNNIVSNKLPYTFTGMKQNCNVETL